MTSIQRTDVRRRARSLVAAAVVALGMLVAAPSGAVNAQDSGQPALIGYVLTHGRAQTVAFPGAADTEPIGINDRGEIVGKFNDATGRDHGFLRTRRGRYMRIDVPGAVGTEAWKINNRGQIVGTYNPRGPEAGDPGSKGFLLDRGRFTTIEVRGAVYTQAEGINDAGDVVGEYMDSDGNYHGFRWHRGRFRIIDVPGSSTSAVTDINDRGDLVGVHGDSTGVRGFVLRNRPRARVESFDAPGAGITLAWGTNDRRQIVGLGTTQPDLSDAQGFLLTGGADGTFRRLEVRGNRAAGMDINNHGQIVGIYENPNNTATDQQPTGATQPTGTLPDPTQMAG
jgi:probable HAF family extracellular repeat protein